MSEYVKTGWAADEGEIFSAHPVTAFTKLCRETSSKKYLGKGFIFPAGSLKVRSNYTDYPFKAHSAFAWVIGVIATDTVPDSVFIVEPTDNENGPYLFVHPRSSRDSDPFYKTPDRVSFGLGFGS
jgi:Xaa-Pro aminopeptidase